MKVYHNQSAMHRHFVRLTQKKVASLIKFYDKIIDAEVLIENSSDKENKITEIKIIFGGMN